MQELLWLILEQRGDVAPADANPTFGPLSIKGGLPLAPLIRDAGSLLQDVGRLLRKECSGI